MLISVGTAFTKVMFRRAQMPDEPPRLGTLRVVSAEIKTRCGRLLLTFGTIANCEVSTPSYAHPAMEGPLA